VPVKRPDNGGRRDPIGSKVTADRHPLNRGVAHTPVEGQLATAFVLRLQRTAGNAAVAAFLTKSRDLALQRDDANSTASPDTGHGAALAEIQGHAMVNLLPLIEKLDEGTRSDFAAGQRVGGPRLVTAMSAVAHKGNWDEFARLNAERLPPLGDQCIGEMMRYIGAPKAMGVADVKHAHVPPPPLASDNDDPDKWRRDPAYIDNITQAFYDPELHDFWVAHTDGSEIHLELSKLSRGPVLYYYQNPSNGKVYPTIFGDQTTPNISWCARESREAERPHPKGARRPHTQIDPFQDRDRQAAEDT
jgi:hypothetical protein